MLDSLNDADWRKDVFFCGFVDINSHLGGKIPKFWGVNRRFPAIRAKYWNLHIMKTTSPTQPNFAQW